MVSRTLHYSLCCIRTKFLSHQNSLQPKMIPLSLPGLYPVLIIRDYLFQVEVFRNDDFAFLFDREYHKCSITVYFAINGNRL